MLVNTVTNECEYYDVGQVSSWVYRVFSADLLVSQYYVKYHKRYNFIAQGIVQQYRYEATFPLLLNTSHHPTYFTALKSSAGLVRIYTTDNLQCAKIIL